MLITPSGTISDRIPLVGIARMAAESPLLRERAEVEYFRLEARSALNRESSGRHAFRLDSQPLPWVRVRLPLLLRPLHPRVHGDVRQPRFRAEDLRQE